MVARILLEDLDYSQDDLPAGMASLVEVLGLPCFREGQDGVEADLELSRMHPGGKVRELRYIPLGERMGLAHSMGGSLVG